MAQMIPLSLLHISGCGLEFSSEDVQWFRELFTPVVEY